MELRLCSGANTQLKPPNLSCAGWLQKATSVESTGGDWERGCSFQYPSSKMLLVFILQFVNWALMEECSLGSTGILWNGQVRLEGTTKCSSLISAMVLSFMRNILILPGNLCSQAEMANSENQRNKLWLSGLIFVYMVLTDT